ncbi:MAG: transglycosylase SLT domain-containing protein [Bacteroidales bacterium]
MIKPYKYIITAVSLLIIIMLTQTCTRQPEVFSYSLNSDVSINAALELNTRIYAAKRKGYKIGFNYELLSKYASKTSKKLHIIAPFIQVNSWNLLLRDSVDVVVFDLKDTAYINTYKDSVLVGPNIQDFAYAFRPDDMIALLDFNNWLSFYKQTPSYRRQLYRYFRSYSLSTENMKTLSPYDDIIKYYAKTLGWDWKLLAALVYQESRFVMGAHSSKSAVGLMQIKPSTAEAYGITNLYDPATNIKAGAAHLAYLQKMYYTMDKDSANVVKFTLGAYNAGEGRMKSCMDFTAFHGKNPYIWDNVATMMNMMNLDYYKDIEIENFKRFRGKETIEYVEEILKKYDEYCYVLDY